MREAPPDRRLADAHQPDEHDRPVETLAQFHHSKGYTAASPARQKPLAMSADSCRVLIIVARASSSARSFYLSTVPKEQPTHTIEVAVPQARRGNAH